MTWLVAFAVFCALLLLGGIVAALERIVSALEGRTESSRTVDAVARTAGKVTD